jgi:hypothetical protein
MLFDIGVKHESHSAALTVHAGGCAFKSQKLCGLVPPPA